MNGPQGERIDEMWAWTTIDPADQTEGVLGLHSPDGWIPMVGADRERMESLRAYVQALVEAQGFTATMVRFTQREEMDRIEPEREGEHGTDRGTGEAVRPGTGQ